MSLVPIKLLKNKVNRDKLLKLKGENAEIDKEDYIESRINTNKRAKNLLAIEDASEIASFTFTKRGSSNRSPKIYKRSPERTLNSFSVRQPH